LNPPTLTLSSSTNPTSCDSNDGFINVTASGGKPPYQFRKNDEALQSFGTFSNLNGGTFTIMIRDANGCENNIDVPLIIASSDLTAIVNTEPDNECLSDNGKITVVASGTATPFQYKIGNGAYSTVNVFEKIKDGRYDVSVKDDQNCSITLSVNVAHGNTGISWNSDIKAIVEKNCALSGCHISGAQSPDLSNFQSAKSNASNMQLQTANRNMPANGKTLSSDDIARIACWVKDGAKEN
jgi:hypothetical protein